MKVKELIEKLQAVDGNMLVATTMDACVDSASPVAQISEHELAFDPNSEGDWLVSHGDQINDDDFLNCIVIS